MPGLAPAMIRRCAGCGYHSDVHEVATRRCPGQSGKFREAAPDDPALWPEIIRRDTRARFAVMEAARVVYVPEVVAPPQVPARAPYGPGELASYQGRQAVGLGRAAAARGWAVSAHYWRSANGTEGCAVKIWRRDLRAVATWKRPPGQLGKASGWAGDVAYAWRAGGMPKQVKHTDLVEMITNDDG